MWNLDLGGSWIAVIGYTMLFWAWTSLAANNDSLIGIPLRKRTKTILLLFHYKRERISALCVISSILYYVIMFLFVLSQTGISMDWLSFGSDMDPNRVFLWIQGIHCGIVIPVAVVEVVLYSFVNWVLRK